MEAANRLGRRKRTQTPLKTMESLGHDTMCIIFTFLDLFDLVRCSAVCKSWNLIIMKSKLLHKLYNQQMGNDPSRSYILPESSLKFCIEQWAMEDHRTSLCKDSVFVDQWKGHATG
ncbi:hypothetical protein Dimus_037162 [Dionaea muscipula]